MSHASASRRALGLAAVGTVVLASAVIGASPALAVDSGFVLDSDVGTGYEVPSGTCAIAWTIVGGRGGSDVDSIAADPASERRVTTFVTEGQLFTLGAGGAGANVADGSAGGTNPEGSGAYDGGPGDGANGGGGGAASVVVSGGDVYLSAYGSAGAGADVNQYGYAGTTPGAGTGAADIDPDAEDFTGPTESASATGRITGTGIACEPEAQLPPEAPFGLWASAGDGRVTVAFSPGYVTDPNGTDADSWEYSVDGGAWTGFTPVDEGWGDLQLELTGLTNGTTYSIRVRGVSDTAGPGAPSDAVSATPVLPIGAPTDVVATAGPSSVRITWSPPTEAGTLPAGSYVVVWNGGQMGGPACQDVPVDAERVCVFPADPGSTGYGFSVWAVDTAGNPGLPSDPVSPGKIPGPTVPDSVPQSDGDLGVPAGDDFLAPGTEIDVSGAGYLPESTVTLVVYSEPNVLGSAEVNASGAFSTTVTLPGNLPAGAHTLVASGVDPDGNPRYLTMPITVTAGPAGLAYTGFEIAGPLAGGVGAVLLGAGLLVASRRRSSV